ncbi:glycosyltransferase [Marimonas arenosa]|uniref:Glycosyltransferase n=1 Tax=Marimonas arenosa TaxID=1795305 RepID=A0AAE4B3P2_9RHOB|nr:glycosyltransferase [Marimonas arenosa]MDQ2090273.1 glycosyltransferase [Marimonas arenosa]
MNKQSSPTRIAAPLSCEDDPHVLILMAVRNGADHLAEQLHSIATQFHGNWSIRASDDGSVDGSFDILMGFAEQGHPLTAVRGPCKGGAENFLSLVRAVPEGEQDGFLAFCDQDDVWMPQRLSHGINALERVPADRPALFCSGTLITDNDLGNPRPSRPRPKPPGFRNALVQNIASGNTILLNPAATRLVCQASHEVRELVVHDWWLYQIVSGAGGETIHDDTPLIYYRQHAENQIGANDTPRAQLKRIMMLLNGLFRDWNEINIAALEASRHRLSPENRQVLDDFIQLRQGALPTRISRFLKLGLYRQSLPGTLALWLSVLLHRL